MQIRHSQPEDLPRLLELYAQARQFMAEHGNPRQWGSTGWPHPDVVRGDITDGTGFVCEEDGQIAACFRLTLGVPDPTYAEITDGAWSSDRPYGVVHRLAAVSGHGAGTFCLRWAMEQTDYLRIDTHPDNVPMRSLLKKLGFRQCGVIHVRQDPFPRYAFDYLREPQR